MHTWRALAAPLLAVVLIAGACGDDDDEEATEPATTTTVEAATDEPPVHTIGVSEEEDRYAFEVPEGIQAGAATFELDNTGEQLHDFQLVRVDGQRTDQDLIELFASEEAPVPDWLHGEGGVGTAAPGSKQTATVELEQGEYVYFCTESDEGEEEDEPASTTTTGPQPTTTTAPTPETSDAHVAKGMIGRFTVSGDSGATLPEADAVISADEYTFSTPASLDAGTSTVELTNKGQQLHHLILFPIVEGKTLDDVKAAFSEEEPSGPPPVDFEKATSFAVVDPGRREVANVNLDPGTYAMVCFIPDRGTAGPPHVAKGMLVELQVK